MRICDQFHFRLQSLLGLDDVKASDVDHLTRLSNLTHLELGDCTSVPEDLLKSLTSLKSLVNLRIERAPHLGENLGELRLLQVIHIHVQSSAISVSLKKLRF